MFGNRYYFSQNNNIGVVYCTRFKANLLIAIFIQVFFDQLVLGIIITINLQIVIFVFYFKQSKVMNKITLPKQSFYMIISQVLILLLYYSDNFVNSLLILSIYTFLQIMLNVYMKGFSAELIGSTRTITQAYTSDEIFTPPLARRPKIMR